MKSIYSPDRFHREGTARASKHGALVSTYLSVVASLLEAAERRPERRAA
jgi:hypothetical protein